MNEILAIDPGTTESGVILWNDEPDPTRLTMRRIMPNADVLNMARTALFGEPVIAIEMIASYGMPVGKETFETVLLIGRLMEAFERRNFRPRLVYRKDVKMFLCGSMKAKDGNIRQALIDKYGAPGTKKVPGKTYGISSHLWSALAIADYALNNPQP